MSGLGAVFYCLFVVFLGVGLAVALGWVWLHADFEEEREDEEDGAVKIAPHSPVP